MALRALRGRASTYQQRPNDQRCPSSTLRPTAGSAWRVARTPHHHQHPTRKATVLAASPITQTTEQRTVILDAPGRHGYGEDDDDDFEEEPVPSPRGAPQVAFVSLVDGKFTVRGRMLVRAPAAHVYGLLTDYGSCQRVFSNIASSEVLRTEAGGLEVVQACRWTFLAFSGTFKVHLGVSENAADRTLLFNLVHSNFMNDFEGRWEVQPAAAPAWAGLGAEREEWCEVTHQLAVEPSVRVPAPVSYYTRSIFVRQVEGILTDLQRGVAASLVELA